MPFQFQCPQGHLLEGEPSQAGQQCNCPMCGMLFIIPAPMAMPVAPAGSGFTPYTPPAPYPQQPAPPQSPAPSFPSFSPGGASAKAEPAPTVDPTQPAEPEILHIPCPNGHELDTPVDMLDQEVLCPQCQAQFRLRRKDSVEHKKKVEEAEQIRLAKLGNKWLNAAIVAVVLVGIGLVGLIVVRVMNQ